MARISKHEYYMSIAFIASYRSSCLHRNAGAVIVVNDRVVATGYNGAPQHSSIDCEDVGNCAKETGMTCRAEGLHAESNAIISAALNGIAIKHSVMYTVFSPCFSCCNMIINAGIDRVYYAQPYSTWPAAKEYLPRHGIQCIQYGSDFITDLQEFLS